MANKTLQFLRNGSAYDGHATALAALKEKLTTAKDGEPVLARYYEGEGQDRVEHTILGIGGPSTGAYEIFDNAGASSDVTAAIQTAINALDSSDSAVSHQFVTAVSEADGVITVTRAQPAADDVSATAISAGDDTIAVDGTDVKTQIENIAKAIKTEQNARQGAIEGLDAEVTSADGTNVQVKVTEVDGVITGVNVTTDNTINNTQLTNAINALDGTDATIAGKVVTSVVQTDGVVGTSNKSYLVDVTLADFSKTTDTGAITSSDTVESALSKIENNITDNEEVTSAALNDLNDRLDTFLSSGITSTDGTITIDRTTPGTTDIEANIDGTTIVKSNAGVLSADLKILKETSGLAANVKEQYKLVYGNNTTAIGDVVQIYKDSALLSVRLLHADLTSNPNVLPTYDKATDTWTDIASPTEDKLALCFAYENENGTQNIVAIPVGDFLRESEFGDGLQVVNGEVSVKKDANSGTVTISDGNTGSQSVDVLTVSSDGIKVANVQEAIDYAIGELDSNVAATAESNNQYSVLTGVTETDGKLTAKTEVLLSAVAKTGAAGDVTITDNDGYFTATNVEDALAELALFDAGTYK